MGVLIRLLISRRFIHWIALATCCVSPYVRISLNHAGHESNAVSVQTSGLLNGVGPSKLTEMVRDTERLER